MSRPYANSILRRSTNLRTPGLRVPRPNLKSPCCISQRHYASALDEHFAPKEKKGFRISYLFGGLAGLGALVTIYGLLEYYFSLDTWPPAIRTPLKAALKARNQGDYERSERYFREAIEIALTMPSTSLEPDPLLELTGLFVSLSSLLESQGQLVKAFIELERAIELFGTQPLERNFASLLVLGEKYSLTEADHHRAIALYQNLGQLALQISSSASPPSLPTTTTSTTAIRKSWDDIAEHYLSGALTAMLKLSLKTTTPRKQVVLGRDADLPAGMEGEGGVISKRGLGMTMEALSEVYAKKAQYDLAAQLLLQAVTTLLPPQSTEKPPVKDRCQAAMLMTTISSHALHPKTSQALKTSKSWSLKALQIADQAIAESPESDPSLGICERARSVGLYNMGMLAEMESDLPSAMNYFNKALTSARATGFSEGKREANEALRRIRNLGGQQ